MANFGNIGGTVTLPNGSGALTPQVIQAMKRRAQLGSAGVNRLSQIPFNPQIQNLDIPQGYGARNDYKRHFFKTNPIVGNAIELHSEFPLSDFHLEHEDGAIEEFLNDMLREANFFEHMMMASIEWWLIGEANSFAFFDDTDNPACYTNFVLLDPSKLTIASNNMVQGHQKETVQLSFDAAFHKIVDNGPNNHVTGELYRHLPSDMVSYCRARQPMPLSPLQVSRLKRGGYFSQRGESSLERVFPLLMLKDELRTMQRAIAKRAINPIELWKIGETGEPADQQEIEAFRELLQSTYYDIGSALVWHHAVNCQVIGAEGRMPQLWSEFDAIDAEVCAGLLINKGLILGDSSTFASDVMRMDILINRYLMFRTKIEKWILQDILAPILKIHEMYVPESKVKSMRYREMSGKGRPLSYPKIRWEKQSLRDETAKLDLLTKLVEQKLVPESTLIRMLNIDPRTAADKVEKEAMDKVDRHQKMLKQLKDKGLVMTPEIAQILGFEAQEPSGGPGGGGGGIPTSIGGGGEPMPAMPNENAALPEVVPGANPGGEGGQTAGIPKADGVQAAPSESQMPVGLPTGG